VFLLQSYTHVEKGSLSHGMIDWWWAYLAVGAFVGFFSGMLGIGGGSAMVPVLAFIFAAKGFPPAHVVHIALGTGVASMLFSAAASVRSHHVRKSVNWHAVRVLSAGVLIGTLGGSLLAGRLDARLLSIAFTAVIFYAATQMLRPHTPRPSGTLPSAAVTSAFGATVGFVSALSATGGAAIVVPFLVKRNIAVHEAIGTAAAIGGSIAVAATVGYVIGGWNTPDLPRYSLGYVYLPALAGVVVASVATAPVGASIAHRMPGRTLRKIFAAVLFALGTGMLVKFL
jgi:uncharacterized membrane protein YfcA